MPRDSAIYLDYNATAPLLPNVQDILRDNLDLVGNPSSIHGFGRDVRKKIENAREKIAALVNTEATSVTFTSGATEANNMVLFGTDAQRILVSAVEHPSIIETVKSLPNVTILPVLPSGLLDLNILEKELQSDPGTTLVSVMWVNNETGVIQPMAEIARIAKKYKARLHSDAVQAAGRLPIDMKTLGIDYLSLSAHKIGGPTGIGALVYNQDTTLKKFIHGGGQERSRRAGTENILGILGFGAAAEYASQQVGFYDTLAQWRNQLEHQIMAAVPKTLIAGQGAPRVGNTLQMIHPSIPAETQLIALDLAGIAVSSGSACSSGRIVPSHVLRAMGYSDDQAKAAIRLSMGFGTTQEQLDRFFDAWVAISQRSSLS